VTFVLALTADGIHGDEIKRLATHLVLSKTYLTGEPVARRSWLSLLADDVQPAGGRNRSMLQVGCAFEYLSWGVCIRKS
jgi:hypothetical protein